MTEREQMRLKNMLSYDYHILGYAQAAGEYLRGAQDKEGIKLAKKCLEKILIGIGKTDPWEIKTLTDERTIAQTIQNQLGDYNRCQSEETIAELSDYFADSFNRYSEGGAGRVKEDLKDFLKMSYGDIAFEVEKIQDKIKGVNYGRTTEEDAEKAKKVLETYQKALKSIHLAESEKILQFEQKVKFEFNQDKFNKMYPEKQKGKILKFNQGHSGEQEELRAA